MAQCTNVTVAADASCTANASIDNGSYDPDAGDVITLTQTPPGPYQAGDTSVTLTVTDSYGASRSCTATVTVVAFGGCTNATVTSLADSGAGSLRQALRLVASGATIDATGLSGSILLTSGPLLVTNSVTILGPGPSLLAVNGNAVSGVFSIGANIVVSISGLSITNGGGSGISNSGATLTISNCTISGNSAPSGSGGGIDNFNFGTLTVINSTVRGNSASSNGGGIRNGRNLTVIDSTVSGNSADNGGGIHNSATLTVINSTLSGNSAGFGGGGIKNFNFGTVTVINSTLSGNSAPSGGGIYTERTLQIGSTVLNAGASGTTIAKASGGSVTSLGFNLSNDNGGGFLTNATDQINTDPMLGPLASYGGPTFTHALRAGSPAIDKGKNLAGSATDQRGEPRPFDDPNIANAAGGDGCDIGSYEASELRIRNVQQMGSDLRLDFTSVLGRNYEVQGRSDLTSGTWSAVTGSVPGNGGTLQNTVTNALSQTQQFYRLHQLP